jgi:hypothetical protein
MTGVDGDRFPVRSHWRFVPAPGVIGPFGGILGEVAEQRRQGGSCLGRHGLQAAEGRQREDRIANLAA